MSNNESKTEDEILLETRQKVIKSLHSRVFDYFKNNKITIPEQVITAINQVFEDVSFSSDDDDVVSIYGKNDSADFETDTELFTQLNIQVDGGNSSGDIVSKYTFYGKLDAENAYTENIGLYSGEKLIDTIHDIKPQHSNKIENLNDWCIVVINEEIFEMGEFNETPRLYIYAPVVIQEAK